MLCHSLIIWKSKRNATHSTSWVLLLSGACRSTVLLSCFRKLLQSTKKCTKTTRKWQAHCKAVRAFVVAMVDVVC